MSTINILKRPSAWIPIALSLVVVVIWSISFIVYGIPKPQPDEGTATHLFQIWLSLEIVMIGFFGIKWLPQNPKSTLLIIIIQITAVLIGCFPIYYFRL